MADKNSQIINTEQETFEKNQQELLQKIVVNCTNLTFDPKDQIWNDFIIQFYQVITSLKQYTSPIYFNIAKISSICLILMFLQLYFNIFAPTTLFAKLFNPANINSLSLFIGRFFIVYFWLAFYILPYGFIYYKIRHNKHFVHIIKMNFKHSTILAKLGFLFVSFLVIFDTLRLLNLISL